MPHCHPQPSTNSRWLADSLAELLASPHISIPDELGEGPEPIDLFSTRFEELFMPDARGYVETQELTREELKETLIGLQKRWDVKEARCVGCEVHPAHIHEFHPSMAARLEFTPLFRYPRNREVVMAEARGKQVDGTERIDTLMLEGDESLLRPDF